MRRARGQQLLLPKRRGAQRRRSRRWRRRTRCSRSCRASCRASWRTSRPRRPRPLRCPAATSCRCVAWCRLAQREPQGMLCGAEPAPMGHTLTCCARLGHHCAPPAELQADAGHPHAARGEVCVQRRLWARGRAQGHGGLGRRRRHRRRFVSCVCGTCMTGRFTAVARQQGSAARKIRHQPRPEHASPGCQDTDGGTDVWHGPTRHPKHKSGAERHRTEPWGGRAAAVRRWGRRHDASATCGRHQA